MTVFVSSRCFVPIAKEFKVVSGRNETAAVQLHMQISQDSIAEGCPMPEKFSSEQNSLDTIPSTIPDKILPKR
jgi:hypothetical protein